MAAAPPQPPPQGQGGAPSFRSFSGFFESWISEQTRDLAALRAAASAVPDTSEAELRSLVDRVLAHYEDYYETKAAAAAEDILRMFSPSWTSTTEKLFLWCGGWRPTAALHLLYTKSGMQLESQLPAFLNGEGLRPDLSDLTVEQLLAADKLQRATIKKEREIEEVAAHAQEALTTVKMLELAVGRGADAEAAMELEMQKKAEGMKNVLEMADTLRKDTMLKVVALLRPRQAVHFLIAAAELHLAVHHFGRRKDGHGGGAAAPAPPPAQ